MSDDTVIPPWKRARALARTPEKIALSTETRRAKASVKEALLNAFDKLGNEAFSCALGNGGAEDRRCLAMIYAKLIPLEVQGSLDHSLTVKVVTQLGEREVLIDRTANLGLPPKDLATGERLEVVPQDA